MISVAELVETSREVEHTRSRKQKSQLLAAVFERLTPTEVPIVVRYVSGELRQGKLGFAWSDVSEAMAEPAAASSSVTALELDSALDDLGRLRGPGTSAERRGALTALFARLTPEERQFVAKLIAGEMRHGVGEGLTVDALSLASNLEVKVLRQALLFLGDLSRLATLALVEGEGALGRQSVEPFRPLRPMLAQASPSVADAYERATPCVFEHKLDGARIQVHRAGERVAIYSRTGNDVTSSLPEVVELVLSFAAESFVLDGEVIALRADGRPEAFQTTMRRFGRKANVASLASALPLNAYFFDCLFLNERALVSESNARRFEALASFVPPSARIERRSVDGVESAEEVLREALSLGHEGVLVKNVDSLYEAGRRGGSWLKVKPAPTLDLVVLAAEWGSGRRKGYLSNLHLGARDEHGSFVMLGKTFKGLTDATLAWQTEKLQKLATQTRGHVVFVRPTLVVEVAFDGVQKSRAYPCGLTLRFARVRRYRDDKPASQADTIESVRSYFEHSRR
jgi:DNA ligase-1